METAYNRGEISDRIQKLLEKVNEARYKKRQFWGEGLSVLNEETAKLPLVKRKALAIKKVLSEMPVEIKEGELLVGLPIKNPCTRAMLTGKSFPEYATQAEKNAAMKKLTGPLSVWGHFSPYYPRYLKLGITGLRKMAEDKLNEASQNGAEPDKIAWHESVILSLDALKYLIMRYRALALKLADSEADAGRRDELNEIARISENLTQRAPQTFREALQAVWFAHMAFSSTLNFLSLGRFDQYLWPYLRRDFENGAITKNEAHELVECFWVKLSERLQTFQMQEHEEVFFNDTPEIEAFATGIGRWGIFMGGKTTQDRMIPDGATSQLLLQTVTVGGLTPEGRDGTNKLTYICLDVHRILKTPQPSLYVRFHDGSSPELYQKTSDCLRTGSVGPCIYNDETIIPGFVEMGIPVEHARDYTADGCYEAHVQGRTHFKHAHISLTEALDRVLSPEHWEQTNPNQHIMEDWDPFKDSTSLDPYGFNSYEEVLGAFKEKLDQYVEGFIKSADIFWDDRLYHIAPLPLVSAFVEGPLESGKDVTQGGMEYSFFEIDGAGLSHVADSLAVIKKLCFEEKKIEWSELLDAIRNNWQGKEYLRQLVRTRVPAYGNDADYVDDIAREIVEYFISSVKKHRAKVRSKAKYPISLATFEAYTMMGKLVGATADGRLEGEPLGNNASPSIGRAVSGQTAALNSYLKLPLADLPAGAIIDLNMESRDDLLSQLGVFIKSFVERRGNLMSIAVNDCQKLKAALREPEKYRDLKVRVGGFEAYFVDLPPLHQEMQVKRCEQYARGRNKAC